MTSGSTWTRSAAIAREHKPKLIIAGATAYPRHWDFAAFRGIADEVGAYLLVDMSHFSGLVAGGAHPSPFPHAHVVTTTTHKSLRGPRSGVILWNDEATLEDAQHGGLPGPAGRPAGARDRRQGGRASAKRCGPSSRLMPRAWSRTPRRSPRASRNRACGSSRAGPTTT